MDVTAAQRDGKHALEIFLVSLGAILLEISFTRVIGFKLFYHFTFLIIGFALLGLGSGGVLVAVSRRIKAAPLDVLVARSALAAALATALGYRIVAKIPLNGLDFWSSAIEPLRLAVMCAALYLPFAAVGVILSSVFGRHAEVVARLYAIDLLGAGLGCALAIPLLIALTPPGCIFLAAAIFALAGVVAARRRSMSVAVVCAATALGFGFIAISPTLLPDPVTDLMKTVRPQTKRLFSAWNPVFRVDVTENILPGNRDLRVIHHDGLLGSTLHRYDGNPAPLGRFDTDVRALAFAVADRKPKKILIIGAAGGHEILAALHFDAEQITAVELNPVTVSLLTDVFADYTGRIAEHPKVRLINDEGRTFLARTEDRYDLVFFVAPDSYTAMNAASSAAFVLSESYLYTAEMIEETLDHLTDDGLLCMHFGEFDFDAKPNRTIRYLATARAAFEAKEIPDFRKHALVASSPSLLQVATMLLKKSPFTTAEAERFLAVGKQIPGTVPRFVDGTSTKDPRLAAVIELPVAELATWFDEYPYQVTPVRDDAPFFWHFARFSNVIRGLGGRTKSFDNEDSTGERSLLAMLAISVSFAVVFLLLPFVAIRDIWTELPRKRAAMVYFAAVGFGFMLYEIALIQKLVLYLGYPTYSLTVTLMSLLIFTGIGSLLSDRYTARPARTMGILLAALALLTVCLLFGTGPLFHATLPWPILTRAIIAGVAIAPLGIVLGAFMPLGLTAVAGITRHKDEYVAWGWAVNGFASVVGSVSTTILSMSFGFSTVLLLALASYCIASTGLIALRRAGKVEQLSRP